MFGDSTTDPQVRYSPGCLRECRHLIQAFFYNKSTSTTYNDFRRYPKNPWTLQWKGLNQHRSVVGSSKWRHFWGVFGFLGYFISVNSGKGLDQIFQLWIFPRTKFNPYETICQNVTETHGTFWELSVGERKFQTAIKWVTGWFIGILIMVYNNLY